MRYSAILFLFLLGCRKDDDVTAPSISAISVEPLGDSLYFTGKVTSGNNSIEKIGFALGNDKLPTTGANDVVFTGKINDGYFRVSRINDYEDNDIHYCRPFVKTNTDFVYGEDLTFYGAWHTPILVESFAPTEGENGDFVKIFGSGFGTNPSNIRVFFGETEAKIESMSMERIVVKVPDYKLSRSVPITVQRNIEKVEANDLFTLSGPRIVSVDILKGMDDVTIHLTGDHFSQTTWRNSVKMGRFTMTVLASTTTELTVKINTKRMAPGSYDISVTVDDKTGVASTTFEVETPWKSVTAKPGGGLCNSVQFVIGNKIYTCSGVPTPYLSDPGQEVWQFDMLTDTWKKMANFPGEARMGGVGFSINGKGYLATGGYVTPKADLWEYNPELDQWTQKSSLPDGARAGASAFSYQGKGYVIFGSPAQYGLPDRKDFWEYYPDKDQWDQLPDFEGKGRYHSKVFMRGDNLYVAGGVSFYDSFSPDLWRFNFSTKQWTLIGQIDFAALGIYIYNDKVYILGSNINNFGSFETIHFQFDPDHNERLEEGFLFPGVPRDMTNFSTTFNNTIYFGLGTDVLEVPGVTQCLSDIWKLDLTN